jgi:hypothetical protein
MAMDPPGHIVEFGVVIVIDGSSTVIVICADAGQPPIVDVADSVYVVVTVGLAIGLAYAGLFSA